MAVLKATNGKILGVGNKALSIDAEPVLKAVAIYSDDDKSFTFYGIMGSLPKQGESYNGKTVTNIYTDFENEEFSSSTRPWGELWNQEKYPETVKTDKSFESVQPLYTSYWFAGFQYATDYDLQYLDLTNCQSMNDMFNTNYALAEIDITGFDTKNITNMGRTFAYCSSLKTIYVSQGQFNIENVTSSQSMFMDCSKLVGGNGTAYSSSNVDSSMAHIDTAENPGYFTAK